MNPDNLRKHFISDIDKFLAKLRAELPLSASQRETIAKHERLANLRDDASAGVAEKDIWEEF